MHNAISGNKNNIISGGLIKLISHDFCSKARQANQK